jgi:hypothetical protein
MIGAFGRWRLERELGVRPGVVLGADDEGPIRAEGRAQPALRGGGALAGVVLVLGRVRLRLRLLPRPRPLLALPLWPPPAVARQGIRLSSLQQSTHVRDCVGYLKDGFSVYITHVTTHGSLWCPLLQWGG